MRDLILPFVAVALFALGTQARQVPTPSAEAKLQLENVALKQQLALATAQRAICEGQLAPEAYKATLAALQTATDDVVKTFETAHPGWTLDPKTGHATKKGGS